MSTNPVKTNLALELGRTIVEMRSRSRQFIQAKIKEGKLNITYEMLDVLICLWRNDGINQQEIADHTIKEKASMTYLIDNLVKRGLVKRSEDENDRRNKLILLTDAGKQLQDDLQPWANELYTAAADGLSAEDILAATQLIQTMTKNIKL
jgi:DNA-binding MarR family transcriptional regulator